MKKEKESDEDATPQHVAIISDYYKNCKNWKRTGCVHVHFSVSLLVRYSFQIQSDE